MRGATGEDDSGAGIRNSDGKVGDGEVGTTTKIKEK